MSLIKSILYTKDLVHNWIGVYESSIYNLEKKGWYCLSSKSLEQVLARLILATVIYWKPFFNC